MGRSEPVRAHHEVEVDTLRVRQAALIETQESLEHQSECLLGAGRKEPVWNDCTV